MKRFGTWLATHIPLVVALSLVVGFGVVSAATGDYHIPSGLILDSNAQLVSTQRAATIGFSAGDHYLPNAMLVDSNGQLVMTLRDSSGNAITPGAATTLTTVDNSSNVTDYPIFTSAITGSNTIMTDSAHMTYNPFFGILKVRKVDLSQFVGTQVVVCTDISGQTKDCVAAAAPPSFGALAATCSATLSVPCVSTGNCATSGTASCTFTATVPASSTCVATLTDAAAATGPWLSVGLSTNTLTVTETYTTTTTLTKHANIVCT